MNLHPLIIFITGILIILWVYASFSKLFSLHRFRQAMMTQVSPRWIGKILLYVIPLIEIGLVILLFIPKTRLFGMYSSLFLMLLFTLYVGGAVFQIYDRHPCAYGGLFRRLSWYRHFKVNIMLTLIALVGVILMEL